MNLVAYPLRPLRLKSWLFTALSLLTLLALAGSLLARHPAGQGARPGSPASRQPQRTGQPLIVVRKSAQGASRPKVVRALPPASAPTPR